MGLVEYVALCSLTEADSKLNLLLLIITLLNTIVEGAWFMVIIPGKVALSTLALF
jgi:hypothetical protein